MKKWRRRYSFYFTECLSKASEETASGNREVVYDGSNLTFSPQLSTRAAITVVELSDQLRAAKLSALFRDTTAIVSATHASSFVAIDAVCRAPVPPVFDLPDFDDESLPSTVVIQY